MSNEDENWKVAAQYDRAEQGFWIPPKHGAEPTWERRVIRASDTQYAELWATWLERTGRRRFKAVGDAEPLHGQAILCRDVPRRQIGTDRFDIAAHARDANRRLLDASRHAMPL